MAKEKSGSIVKDAKQAEARKKEIEEAKTEAKGMFGEPQIPRFGNTEGRK